MSLSRHDRNIVQSQPTLALLVAEFVNDNELSNDPAYVLRWTLNQFARNDFDTFDPQMRQAAIETAPPSTGHPGWDAFFAALADYLAQRDNLTAPRWIDEPSRSNAGSMFYPANDQRDPDAMKRWLENDPAPWFTKRGVGIVLRALPSGEGKHVPATL